MLNNYKVLDLTGEKGFLCGKILGDLGTDVIKIEQPSGDPARLRDLSIMTKSIRIRVSTGSR